MTARTPDITLPEVVTYDGLPSGAHALRVKRPPDVAFQRLQTFLEACIEPVSLPSWTLEIRQGGPPAPTAQLTELATGIFGGPPRYKAQTHTEWNVPPGSVNEALDALVGSDAVTTHGRSLAALTCSAPVRLIDPTRARRTPPTSPPPTRSAVLPWMDTAELWVSQAYAQPLATRHPHCPCGSTCLQTNGCRPVLVTYKTISRSGCPRNTGVSGGRTGAQTLIVPTRFRRRFTTTFELRSKHSELRTTHTARGTLSECVFLEFHDLVVEGT